MSKLVYGLAAVPLLPIVLLIPARTPAGDARPSQALLQQRLNEARERNDKGVEADTLVDLAALDAESGQLDEADRRSNAALALCRQLAASGCEARALLGLSEIQAARGDHQGAIGAFLNVIRLAQRAGDRATEAAANHGLAVSYYVLGDYTRALPFAEAAERLFAAAGKAAESGVSAGAVGALHGMLGHGVQAEAAQRRALRVHRRTGDRRREALALSNLGVDYVRARRFNDGFARLREAEFLFHALGDTANEAGTIMNTGAARVRAGQFDAARKELVRAVEMFRARNDALNEASALGLLARAELGLSQPAAALADAERAFVIVERERSKLVVPELQASLSGSFEPVYDVLIDAHLALAPTERARIAIAFSISDHARARLLLDRFAHLQTEARAATDPLLQERERTLRAAIEAASAEPASPRYEVALAEYQELQARLRSSSAALAALTEPAPVSPDEARARLLGPDTALVEFWLGDRRSAVWVLTESDLEVYPLPSREEIEKLVSQFSEELRTPSAIEGPGRGTAGALLADTLLTPFLSRLSGRRLLIVPHGALNLVPFAALPIADRTTGHRAPLLEQFATSVIPSAAAAIAAVHRPRPSPPKLLAVFADPEVTPSASARDPAKSGNGQTGTDALGRVVREFRGAATVGRLPFTRQEAGAIQAFAPPGSSDIWLGTDATRERVLNARLSDYRFLHFATHGLAAAERPEASGLVLSLFDERGQRRDGYLRLIDVYNLRLNAEVVVLSACETAVGPQMRGEGLVGLARAFESAGAQRVVATLWKIDDESTSALMTEFYAQMLQRGAPAPAALRAAQLKLSRTERWKAPYFWAAFVLYGR